MPAVAESEKVYTNYDLADLRGVTSTSAFTWTKRADFPKKRGTGKKKYWLKSEVLEYLDRNGLGLRNGRGGAGYSEEVRTLRDRKIFEESELTRIKKEQQQLQLQADLKNIFWAADVRQRDEKIAAVTMTILEQIPDAVDKAIGNT